MCKKETHIHNDDASLVKLLHDPLWWYTDGTDKELCLLLDDHVDELRELTLGVIVLRGNGRLVSSCFAYLSQDTHVRLACIATDLWEKQVNTEGRVLILKVTLQGLDLQGCGNDWVKLNMSLAGRGGQTWERNTFGVYPTPPMTPNPPAFVTAAASSGPAATFMPGRGSVSTSCIHS